jgi:2-polyprenyl-3-methyl-5-hydroxy-6-metoxy-1,4-benzoquinol methylase
MRLRKFIYWKNIFYSFCGKDETSVKLEMGMFYNPLTKNWSWSKDKGINYAMTAQKFQTTVSNHSNPLNSSTSNT